MILALAIALSQNPTPPNSVDGAALISKMFAYYAAATHMVGRIQMIQSADNTSIEIDTDLDYKAPAKLYVRQILKADPGRQWLVTSDGTVFSYDFPNEERFSTATPEPNRPWEQVRHGMDYRQIFRVATRSLGDLSLPELVAIAGQNELITAKNQIATVSVAGRDQIGGEPVTVLTGDWRLDEHSAVSGKYRMWLADDGELKRFEETELVALNMPGIPPRVHQVVTTWNADLNTALVPDDSVFAVAHQ